MPLLLHGSTGEVFAVLILASLLTTHFGQWRQSWHGTAPTRKAGQPLLGAPPMYEGALALLDWDRGTVLWQAPFDTPGGFCFRDDHIYLCSMLGNRIYVLDEALSITSTLSTPQMNDLHTVINSRRGLLITSSGLDGIVELTTDGDLLWAWLATEHGFDRSPGGIKRQVSTSDDLRRRDHGTTMQTTHCNSAIFLDPATEDHILVTLFHQGALIRVNRRTGRHDVLVDGMSHAHAIRPAPDGLWTCCDSQCGSVVILEPDFRIRRIIEGSLDWPQDAFTSPDGTVFVADSNHNRVAAYRLDGTAVGELVVPEEWKFFQIEPVPDAWVARLRGWRPAAHLAKAEVAG